MSLPCFGNLHITKKGHFHDTRNSGSGPRRRHGTDNRLCVWSSPAAFDLKQMGTRPDLVWDNEMPGLCVRVYGSGEKSFIFVYRRDNRQRFIRIGTTPRWSFEGARRWAKELRSAIDRGHDPELYNHERQKIKPVESFIQLIAETQQSEPGEVADEG